MYADAYDVPLGNQHTGNAGFWHSWYLYIHVHPNDTFNFLKIRIKIINIKIKLALNSEV